jgi:hypothetical protein
MNANKLKGKSDYFQNGYYDGSSGWRCSPNHNCEQLEDGSYAYSEYVKGWETGKEDR